MKKLTSSEEFTAICRRELGLVYNDFTKGGSAENNILHAVWCPWLAKSNLNVDKLFFMSQEEAVSWLTKNRGVERVGWKRCGSCHAHARGKVPLEHADNSAAQNFSGEIPMDAAGLFTEAKAEKILANHLRKQGHKINVRVPCSSGYIDLVAEKEGRSIIIEVKGEDKGGYTSAEMNFQMGLGQIISRMTDPKASYALAIPISNDYMRVLRKYNGSFGLNRLGLNFFLVRRDESVESLTASDLTRYIAALK